MNHLNQRLFEDRTDEDSLEKLEGELMAFFSDVKCFLDSLDASVDVRHEPFFN